MYSVEVAASIGEVGAGEWDALADGVPFVRHHWLALAERVLSGHRPRYLLVRKDGGLVAAAVCALEHRLHNPVLESRFGRLTRRWPFLQVQAPMTATSGLLGGEGPQRRVLLRAVRSLVRRERLLFCVVDHLPYAAGQPGYSRLGWLPETLLDLTWPSYEAYLDHLPRKRRAEIRRTQRRAAREGIEVRPLTAGPGGEPDRLLDRLGPMVAAAAQPVVRRPQRDGHPARRRAGPPPRPAAAPVPAIQHVTQEGRGPVRAAVQRSRRSGGSSPAKTRSWRASVA
ncbi:peptidogalycan biosysnthesis protein [Nonomuraea sp. NPDC001684]